MIKCVMMKLGGNNMAGSSYLSEDWWEKNKDDRAKKRHRIAAKELRFDEAVWNDALALMRKSHLNTVLLDLHEGVVYPSHPELAVKGAWTPERLAAEVKRVREMGIEIIPKLNFSTTHSAWQGEWRMKTSSPAYYGFCSDLIRDVCEIFGKPRLFHIGMDEEWDTSQVDEPFVVLRHGDLWYHDCKFLIDEIEKRGVRCWMWPDMFRSEPERFAREIPRTVLTSNWYYAELFDPAKFPPKFSGRGFHAYAGLEKAGFDQVPTGSNWCGPRNMGMTVRYCLKAIAPERLKGFMTASWMRCLPEKREVLLGSIRELASALAAAGLEDA